VSLLGWVGVGVRRGRFMALLSGFGIEVDGTLLDRGCGGVQSVLECSLHPNTLIRLRFQSKPDKGVCSALV